MENKGLTLEQLLAIQREKESLQSPLGENWAHLVPTKGVIQAIHYTNLLKEFLAKRKVLISIAANIGLGKTTYTRIFSLDLGIVGSYELDEKKDHVNDPLLKKFLGPEPNAKKIYCFLLQRRLRGKRLLFRQKNFDLKNSCVEDRTPEEDPIAFYRLFLQQGYLTPSQFDQLNEEAIEAYKKSSPSDLIIVLQGGPELSRLRILERSISRPEELDAWQLEKDLRPLAGFYRTFPQEVVKYGLHKGPVLEIDVNQIDIANRIHLGYIYEQVLERLK